MADLRLVSVSDLPLDAVEKVLAEHRSVVDRARDAIRRAGMDPRDMPTLVREIGKEIATAESAMLKGTLAIVRETFGGVK